MRKRDHLAIATTSGILLLSSALFGVYSAGVSARCSRMGAQIDDLLRSRDYLTGEVSAIRLNRAPASVSVVSAGVDPSAQLDLRHPIEVVSSGAFRSSRGGAWGWADVRYSDGSVERRYLWGGNSRLSSP